MTTPIAPGPLAGPRLWDLAAPGYEREVAPALALFCEEALRLARVGPGTRVADVACGPGSLSFAAADRGGRVSALDVSPEMIALLRARAAREEGAAASGAREGAGSVLAQVGDGMALPWPDGAFDAALSMFGLIFFPDRASGLAELRRVLRPGGRAVISSWVPADRVPVLAEIWAVLDAELPAGPYSRARPALGDAAELRVALECAGFGEVDVHEVRREVEVPSATEYWRSLERSTPPMLATREALPAERWAELSARIARRIEDRFGPGPQRLALVALLGAGTR